MHLAVILIVAGAAPMPTLANPASVFCGAHGGTSVIEPAENGAQTGICVFPNGTRINEWAYFRSMHRTHK